jgi:hypothetical protein
MTKNNRITIHSLVLERLQDLRGRQHRDLLKFPIVFLHLCRSFQLPKETIWKIFLYMDRRGDLKIVRYKGIILKKRR